MDHILPSVYPIVDQFFSGEWITFIVAFISPGRNDRIAKEKHKKCCLVMSRKEKIYIDEDGEIEVKIETKYGDEDYPYVRVR